MIAVFVLVAMIGWADASGGFHCPDKAAACIDPGRLPDLPPSVQSTLRSAACARLDRPGGPICDTALATAIMAACPASPEWWRMPACTHATWWSALAPNLEHGLETLVRAYPAAR